MKTLTLNPIAKVAGEVHLPGSKSISNRVLVQDLEQFSTPVFF